MSRRSGNAHGQVTRAILCGNLQEKCRTQILRRTWTFQKSHFVWKFKGKMPDPPVNTSIEHRAFSYRKNPFSPFSVTTLFGEKSWFTH